MRCIRILRKDLTGDEIEELELLLEAAGFSEGEIEVVEEVGVPDAECDDEIFVIVASPAICADPDFGSELASIQQGGRRAICVWPKEPAADAMPPQGAMNYSNSIIRWNADKLRSVTAEDDKMCFEMPNGDPIPMPDTERNLCVDAEVKPK